jgi:hypothetical protein
VSKLSPRALAGLDDVRAFGYDPSDDQGETDLWIECLNAASDECHRVGRREFVARNATRTNDNDPVVIASQTRTFDVVDDYYEQDIGDGSVRRLLTIDDLAGSGGSSWPPDTAMPSAVRIYSYEGVLLETANLAAILPRQRNREPWEPIEELEFRAGLTTSASIGSASHIEVDGKWGFPQIPDGLRRACANQAAVWFARDVRNFSTTFSLESGRFEVVRDALAPAVKSVVKGFRRQGLG